MTGNPGPERALYLRDSLLTGAAALTVRLIHLLFVSGHPLASSPVVDARWHHLWAGLVSGGDLTPYAPFFRAPLYPWTLGLWYRVMGQEVITGSLLSILFGAFSAVIVYRIASVRMPRRWALAAGMIWAFWGTDVFYSGTLLITGLYTMLLLLSYQQLDSGSGKLGWLFLGLACIARPSAIVLVPLAFFIRRPGRLGTVLFILPVLAVWTVNLATGDPATVISNQGGINLYLGNGPDSDGYTAFATSGASRTQPDSLLPYTDNVQQASRTGLPPDWTGSRVSAHWTARALDHAAAHPLEILLLAGRKLIYLVSPVEIPSNYDPYYFRSMSPVLGLLLIPRPVGLPFLLLWILLPGALAAGALKGREIRLLLWPSLLFLSVLPFFVTARFRLPAVPFILIFLLMRFSRKPRKGLLLAPAGAAVGILLSLLTWHTVSTGGVNMPFFDGIAHVESGDLDGARVHFLEAVTRASYRTDDIDMNRTDALFNLGVIALRQGFPDEAASWWRAALEYNPGFQPARDALWNLQGLD
jgi:hypothetical protein